MSITLTSAGTSSSHIPFQTLTASVFGHLTKHDECVNKTIVGYPSDKPGCAFQPASGDPSEIGECTNSKILWYDQGWCPPTATYFVEPNEGENLSQLLDCLKNKDMSNLVCRAFGVGKISSSITVSSKTSKSDSKTTSKSDSKTTGKSNSETTTNSGDPSSASKTSDTSATKAETAATSSTSNAAGTVEVPKAFVTITGVVITSILALSTLSGALLL